jgi:hypothetical protein
MRDESGYASFRASIPRTASSGWVPATRLASCPRGGTETRDHRSLKERHSGCAKGAFFACVACIGSVVRSTLIATLLACGDEALTQVFPVRRGPRVDEWHDGSILPWPARGPVGADRCILGRHVDKLILAGDAAAILERLGVSAYGKRSDGRVTIDGWAHASGKRIAFSYEVDEDVSPEELAERCMVKVRDALAQGG